MTGAGSVEAARSEVHQAGSGANPTPALQQIVVRPVPHTVAREIIEANHYLHSMPGGTQMCFGVFVKSRLLGAMTIGCGPAQAYKLVNGVTRDDCATLSRLWLSDELPKNSESRVLGVVLRNLKRQTSLKFILSYADESQGHRGVIYMASGWTYTGLSEAMPLYDLGDGVARHSRSLSHAFGTHSIKHFQNKGIELKQVPLSGKDRYNYFIDTSWKYRLTVPVLPYPKQEQCT